MDIISDDKLCRFILEIKNRFNDLTCDSVVLPPPAASDKNLTSDKCNKTITYIDIHFSKNTTADVLPFLDKLCDKYHFSVVSFPSLKPCRFRIRPDGRNFRGVAWNSVLFGTYQEGQNALSR